MVPVSYNIVPVSLMTPSTLLHECVANVLLVCLYPRSYTLVVIHRLLTVTNLEGWGKNGGERKKLKRLL